jgi:transcriptional regulator with XRE-family HTH domain
MKSIHDPRYSEFVQQLILARLFCQLTQTELAVILGRPQSYVAKVETLERRIDIIETWDWLRALGLDPNEFFAQIDWRSPGPLP